MKKMMMKSSKEMKKSIINLPTPSSITYMWNFGSMIGIMMSTQIITGLMVSMHYVPYSKKAFSNYVLMSKNVSNGYSFKYLHSTGVSVIFMLIFIHMYRSMLNMSTKNKKLWSSGLMILIMTMMTAFLGYVLPWGQMSLWGATVICNMASSIPLVGEKMVKWMWGNFTVSDPTLNRFFSFHFMLPFTIMAMMIIHLMILHSKGSSNNISSNSHKDKISFKKKFYFKDLNTILIMMMISVTIMYANPQILIDPENFNPSNPLITPIHIMPEWYFLFAYAMLRAIPNKLGGILVMISSILILMFMDKKKMKTSKFNPKKKMTNKMKAFTFMNLSILGSKPIEKPYMMMSILMSILYFSIMTM